MERKRSWFWAFFSRESENKSKCNLCHLLYSIKGGSPTNLKKHVLIKHHAPYDSLFLSSSVEPPSETEIDVPSTCQQFNFIKKMKLRGTVAVAQVVINPKFFRLRDLNKQP